MKTYAIVGAGSRGTTMYAVQMQKYFSDCASIVGVCDVNKKRCAALIDEAGLTDCRIYDCFDEMLDKEKPDVVIVTTIDCFHHEYIIKALDFGCDVISEKPLTVDEQKYKMIAEAEKRAGKKVIVTFNCRFMPFFVRVKQLLMEGTIGEVLSVHYEWYLDTSHGADYFRRWHRRRKNSGSLLIHKASHHFDIANWLLEQEPEAVNAFGTRRFYGPSREKRGERCLTCQWKKECEFYLDITANPFLKKFYYDCEDEDGYYRDRCVFSEDIDIEDSVSINVRYQKGAVMSYSLTAHSPYEGYRIVLNGQHGRLIAEHLTGTGFYQGKNIYHLYVFNRKGEKIEYQFPEQLETSKTHDGGDIRLLEMLIRGGLEDPLGQVADSYAGAMAIAIGIAANHSLEEKRQVQISEFL